MSFEIINLHFREGGTGITNFSPPGETIPECRFSLEAARIVVAEDQFKHEFQLVNFPMPPMRRPGHALHSSRRDCSDFWKRFDEVRDEMQRDAEKAK